MSKRFDVVVVGGRLSAVLTVALLAKRGLRGLIVDQGELATLGSDHPDDDVWTAAGSDPMERVLAELELKDELKRSYVPSDPLLHVIFPDDRIDLTADLDRTALTLDRVLGGGAGPRWRALHADHDAVGAFLASGAEVPPPAGFFGRRGSVSAAKRTPALGTTWDEPADDLAELALGAGPFLTHLDPRDGSGARRGTVARALCRYMAGAGTVRHPRGFRGLLLDYAEKKAVQVRRTAVEQIEPEGKGWSVRIAGARDPVLADALVDASTDLSGAEVIPTRKQGRQLPQLLQAARPRGYLYAYGLEVDENVLPPGLGRRMLLLNGRRDPSRFDPNQPNSEDRPIWLVVRRAEAPGRTELVALHPFSVVQAHGTEAMATKDTIVRARLERLFPFLPEGRPEPFMPGAEGHGPPFLSHPHLDPGLDEVTGLGGIPTRSPLKHLFFAGPAVAPGLGQEGEYLSALQAADAVDAALTGGKKSRGPRLEV